MKINSLRDYICLHFFLFSLICFYFIFTPISFFLVSVLQGHINSMLFLTLRKITACIWRVLLHLVQYWVSEIYFSGWCFWRKCFWRSTRIEIVDFNIMMIWSWNKHVLFRCFFLFPNMCLYYSVDVCAFKRLLIPSNNHLHNREITYLISSLISSLYFLQLFYTIHSLIFPYMEKYFATYLDIFYLFHRLNPYMFDKGWYQTLFFIKKKNFLCILCIGYVYSPYPSIKIAILLRCGFPIYCVTWVSMKWNSLHWKQPKPDFHSNIFMR